jgi:hypothetical protein
MMKSWKMGLINSFALCALALFSATPSWAIPSPRPSPAASSHRKSHHKAHKAPKHKNPHRKVKR